MLLEIADLVVRYGRTVALSGVGLTLAAGEIVTVLGANGAGKSSLLKAIQGVVRPAAGAIRFDGRSVVPLRLDQRLSAGLVLVPEGRQILISLTIHENLQLGAYLRADKHRVAAEIDAIYARFDNLAKRRDMPASCLSGGEQQMLAIGRALLAKPRLLMLDEPSLGLSPLFVQRLFDLISTLNRDGLAILLIEQNTNMALTVAHRAYLLELGRVVRSGQAAAMRQDSILQDAYLGRRRETPKSQPSAAAAISFPNWRDIRMSKRALSCWFLALGLTAAAALPVHAADLVLGLSMNKTGPLSANGTTNDVIAQVAVDEINAKGGVNGSKLVLSVFDTASDPKQAVIGLRKFAEDDHAMAIIGPFSSGECRVAFPAGERAKIVEISNAASAPGITKGFSYAFHNTSDELTQFRRLLKAMDEKSMKPKNAAIIYGSDEFISKSLGTDVFPTAFKGAGIPIVASIGFPLQAFDLGPQITELKQTNPDVVAIGGSVEAVIKVVHEMRRQGMNTRVLTSGVAADPGLAEKLGKDGDNLLYPTYYYHKLNDQVLAFQKKFATATKAANISKTVPQHADVSAYDIVYMLAESMRRAKVTGASDKLENERTAIRDQLRSMKDWDFQGVIGREYFNAEGDAILPTYIVEIRNGDFTMLSSVTE